MDNQLKERYIQAVTRQVPLKAREATARALRAEIEAKLKETDEATIDDVLRAMGAPEKRAESYLKHRGFLQSKTRFAKFVELIGWLLPLIAIVAFFGGLLASILDGTRQVAGVANAVARGIVVSLIATGIALLVIGIIFFLIDRKAVRRQALSDRSESGAGAWSPDALPSLQPVATIPMSSSVAELAFALFFPLIAWFLSTGRLPAVVGDGASCVPLFHRSFLAVLFPATLIVSFFSVVASVWKLADQRYSTGVTASHIVSSVVAAGVWLYVIHSTQVISDAAFEVMRSWRVGGFSFSRVFSETARPIWLTVITALIVIGTLIEIVRTLRLWKKASRVTL